MTPEERHRLAVYIDIALRETTTAPERAAALSRIAIETKGRSIADLVKAITEDNETVLTPRPLPVLEKTRPWLEYKAEHEQLQADVRRLRREVEILKSPRYERSRVKPDANGNVPYPTFLVALLAARDWQVRDCLSEFWRLANVDAMDVMHWRDHNAVPYYFYKMLATLPFEGSATSKTPVEWTDEAERLLREYFAVPSVKSDKEIAENLSERLGVQFSQRAVHTKAFRLGLLTNVKRAGRRLSHSPRRAAAE